MGEKRTQKLSSGNAFIHFLIKSPGRNFDSSFIIFFLTIRIQFSAIELVKVTLAFPGNFEGPIMKPVHSGHIGI